MPQALKTLCLIHFWGWKISIFPLLALWGNKNWPPSMKVKKMEAFWNKSCLKGCKWSGLNAPDTENPLNHPLLGWKNSLFPLLALWGNKNWPPSMKGNKFENFQKVRGAKGCKWSSLNAPGTANVQTPCPILFWSWKLSFSQYWPSGVIRIGLPVWKSKSCQNVETKVT